MVTSLHSLFLVLVIARISIMPTYSTSRGALHDHHTTTQTSFQVKLQHVDSGKNFTKFELLQRALERSNHRLDAIRAILDSTSNIDSPVNSGSGEFLMNLAIGTPPESFAAIMDTGSDLIWTQCEPCTQCFSQPNPIYNPQDSSSFSQLPCSSQLCQALPSATCSNGCQYSYSYGDGSSTQGYMGSETFTFESTPVPNIGFGCGQNNSGFGGSNGAGLVGMGRGPLSLPSQVNANQFSYCMTSVDSTATSTLQIGSLSTPSGGSTVTTPLIQNPQIPTFYYLGLNDISVGGSPLGIPQGTFAINSDGSGELIIDSGTTITYLVTSAYSMVKQAFTSQTNLPAYTGPSVGFDCCFQLPSDTSNVQVPSIVMHFNGADVSLPTQNYFIEVSQGVVCLAMIGAQDMSIYGNIQQQNFEILYDVSNNVLSFTPTQCGSSS
ncbi:hypothetical protein Ancab_034735 [Ancistrocladus abbreviatus]